VSFSIGDTVPRFPQPGGQYLCPPGTAVVGYKAAVSQGSLFGITLRCAAFTVTGSISSGYAVTVGSINDGPSYLSATGTSLPSSVPANDCPSGMIARGIGGTDATTAAKSFYLDCGTPVVPPVTTGPAEGGARVTVMTADCPKGEVPIGFATAVSNTSTYTGVLTDASLRCGKVMVTSDGQGGWTVSTSNGATLPYQVPWGTNRGISAAIVYCPPNEALVGLAGTLGSGTGTAIGSYPEQATLRCAPISFTGDANAGFTVGYDAANIDEQTAGTLTGGTAFGPDDCPAGTVAKGFVVWAQDILGGLALRCGPVTPTVQ